MAVSRRSSRGTEEPGGASPSCGTVPRPMNPVQRAVEILRRGGVVALPTETVYGLAARADDELAVRRIFAIKGRPATHPLIVHLASAGELEDWAREVPAAARVLAEAFWPGPLTLVLKRSPRVSDAVTGGQGTVALRVPRHPLALEVLAALGGGLAAPSANRFGKVSPTEADHVRADLGADVDLVLDGGPCEVGLESTIVDLSSGAPAILRSGGLPAEDLERVLGHAVPVRTSQTVRVSGSLASHYAPRAGVLLAEPGELAAQVARHRGVDLAVLAPEPFPGLPHFSLPAEPGEAARVLYSRLREADEAGHALLLVSLPDARGLGQAVRDRLMRASAPR